MALADLKKVIDDEDIRRLAQEARDGRDVPDAAVARHSA
jgi:hypothetical protein